MKTDQTFDQLIEESFSNASYMDVREIRALYYGRVNMFVSFSDDGEFVTDGYVRGRLERPAGILAHAVDAVVGRKVSSSLFYGNVFRRKSARGFIEDIRAYNSRDFEDDLEAFYALGYLKDDKKVEAEEAASSPRLSTYFERFWTLTRTAAGSGSGSDKLWARIIMDIGYNGFTDHSGKGILIKDRVPCTIILDTSVVQHMDIVPIQKYRRDPRKRITDKVERKVSKMATTRNRVAKAKVTRYEKPSTISSNIRKAIGRVISGGLL